ncbi:MAG: tetratricopeptide repeat protein [Candidatus Omnitrophota bacterium]
MEKQFKAWQQVTENFFVVLNLQKVTICLVVLGLLGYANAIFHPFVHDDVVFIQNNPLIGRWDNLAAYFLEPVSMEGARAAVNPYYRPLLEVIYKVEFFFFRLNAHGYHLVNILLHIINAILFFRVLTYFLKEKKVSFVAAVLFLLHPVQTESVSCISGISNLVFALLCLLSFIFYLQARESRNKRSQVSSYISSLAFFIMALLAKEQAIVLPALIFLFEWVFYRSEKKDFGKTVFCVGGFLAVAAGYFILRKFILGTFSTSFLDYPEELWLRIRIIPKTLLDYLAILFVPVDLHYYRSIDILQFSWRSMAGIVAVLAGIIAIFKIVSKEYRLILLFALGWFFIWILPVLNIMPLIIEYSSIMTSEHFLYLPLGGFVLFMVATLKYLSDTFLKERSQNIFSIFFIVVVLIFLGATIKQNTYWRGEIPLFERTLKFQGQLGRVHTLLAKAYYSAGEYDKALDEYLKALNIMQEYAAKAKLKGKEGIYDIFLRDVYRGSGQCYAAQQNMQQAIEEYSKALVIDPGDGDSYASLGSAYFSLKNTAKAKECFKQAIQLQPRNIWAMNNLALCYVQEEKSGDAQEWLHKALEINPDFKPARRNLEILLRSKQ